jgi:hypothetical protein
MDQWSAVRRAFAVQTFLRNNDTVITTQKIFRRHFNSGRHGTVPDHNTFKKWVQKFRTSAFATHKIHEGRVRTVRTEIARAAICRGPKRSAYRHSVALNVSSRSLRRIVHFALHFRPYQLHIVRELPDCDFASRCVFCKQFVTLVNEHSDAIRQVVMSDEAHFELPGCVNEQNRSGTNPNELHVKPLHSQSNSMVRDISVRYHWSLFLGGWNWQCGYCDIWPVCAYGEWVLASRFTPSWYGHCHLLVPTRWSNSTHCSAVDVHRKNCLNIA